MTEKEEQRKQVGTRIKSLRLSRGIDLAAFGSLIDPPASASIVSRWERGINLPSNKRMQSIAELSNVSVDYLLNGEPQNDTAIMKAIEKWQSGKDLSGDESDKVAEGITGGALTEIASAEKAQIVVDIQRLVATANLAELGTPALRTIKTTVKLVQNADKADTAGLTSGIQTLVTLLGMNVNPAIAGSSEAQRQAIAELKEQFNYLVDLLES